MFLNLVTPSCRLANLPAVAASINIPRKNYRWIVVVDSARPSQLPPLPLNAEIYWHPDWSIAGNGQRNFAIDKITGGHVFFLDDDTLLHPGLWPAIKNLGNDFIHFNESDITGAKRTGGTIELNKTGSGNFVVHSSLIGDSRWIPELYNADGHFVIEMFRKAKNPAYINKTLSIYNELRPSLTQPDMHKQVLTFINRVKARYPQSFTKKEVLDCGSLDINGTNRLFFTHCNYTGLDIIAGKNVDVVSPVHLFEPLRQFDTIISTEMLEHDRHWEQSLNSMFALLKPGGLIVITAAGFGRPEHGTTASSPESSPATNSYYQNVSAEMIARGLPLDSFTQWDISYLNHDIRFYGIKM